MKNKSWLSAILGSLLISSCADFDTPFSGGSFDPLSTAGYRQQRDDSASGGNYHFTAGQFVTAASNSTAFFSKKPSGNADADELLSAGTTMRVIKADGSFVKVELDNGKVGYVAAALLLECQQGTVAPLGTEPAQPMPADLQPGVAPTDLGEGTPLPPIAAPPSGQLPPSSLDPKPSAGTPLPEPAKGDAVPKPPLGQ